MAFQWNLAALETLMAEEQLDQGPAILRTFSVVELWRLRRVCRAFHRWGTAALAALPRVVAVGGCAAGYYASEIEALTDNIEALDLSTLRWTSSPGPPSLRVPLESCCVAAFPDGRMVVLGKTFPFHPAHEREVVEQWMPGTDQWSPVPADRYTAGTGTTPHDLSARGAASRPSRGAGN